mmetsp:Transcript_4404/g.12887  ORF Transcript_4404/g.12887 Transcript_4404/m.12887 type:complete len:382 (-) Transcript_4404:201-1346(-)
MLFSCVSDRTGPSVHRVPTRLSAVGLRNHLSLLHGGVPFQHWQARPHTMSTAGLRFAFDAGVADDDREGGRESGGPGAPCDSGGVADGTSRGGGQNGKAEDAHHEALCSSCRESPSPEELHDEVDAELEGSLRGPFPSSGLRSQRPATGLDEQSSPSARAAQPRPSSHRSSPAARAAPQSAYPAGRPPPARSDAAKSSQEPRSARPRSAARSATQLSIITPAAADPTTTRKQRTKADGPTMPSTPTMPRATAMTCWCASPRNHTTRGPDSACRADFRALMRRAWVLAVLVARPSWDSTSASWASSSRRLALSTAAVCTIWAQAPVAFAQVLALRLASAIESSISSRRVFALSCASSISACWRRLVSFVAFCGYTEHLLLSI